MSTLSENIRRALYAKLNVASVVGSGKATGIHYSVAPVDAAFPYVVFSRQASSPVTYAFNYVKALEDDFWLIKVVVDDNASTTKEPVQLAEEILALCESALGNSLTLSGGTVRWLARHTDIPPMREPYLDGWLHTCSALFRIQAD